MVVKSGRVSAAAIMHRGGEERRGEEGRLEGKRRRRVQHTHTHTRREEKREEESKVFLVWGVCVCVLHPLP